MPPQKASAPAPLSPALHRVLYKGQFAVKWEPPGEAFRSSLKAVLGGPKPPAWRTTSATQPLRVTWIRGPIPRRALTASTLWHVAIVLILLLPIWKAFGSSPPAASLPELHITWDLPMPDLRPIAPPPPSRPRSTPATEPEKPAAPRVDEAFHPRQTILSQPLKMTHPRQTLIQPNAPAAPPKIVPQLPNVVEWGAASPARLRLEISASQLAPILHNRRREKAPAPQIDYPIANDPAFAANVPAPDIPEPLVQSNTAPHLADLRAEEATVPEIRNDAANSGALNIAPSDVIVPRPKLLTNDSNARIAPSHKTSADAGAAPEIVNNAGDAATMPLGTTAANAPQPKMPTARGSGPISRRKRSSADVGAAPNVSAKVSGGDSSLRRIVAISSAPAPPAPEVQAPRGNLAAPVAMSPTGTSSGPTSSRANSARAAKDSGAALGAKSGVGPAGVSISAANTSMPASTAGPSANVPSPPAPPPKPVTSPDANAAAKPPAPVNPMRRRPTFGPGDFDSGMPPERILGEKKIYTLYVNLPNLTSASGSWILNFAQLRDTRSANFRSSNNLSAPVPVRKVDPKYPESLIDAHVEGEVVLYSLIRSDGSVDSIQVLKSLDPQLDRNAMEALSRWKFSPATLDGVPVDLEAVIHIPFHPPSEF